MARKDKIQPNDSAGQRVQPNRQASESRVLCEKAEQHRRKKQAQATRQMVLWVQMAVCAVLLGGVLLCRVFAPATFEQMRADYFAWFEAEDATPKLVRFASAWLDNIPIFISVDAAEAPQGSAQEVYLPTEEVYFPLGQAAWYCSSGYGWRQHPILQELRFHRGTDLACAEGTPVLAALDGVVTVARKSTSYGNYLRIHNADGVETLYAHLQYLFVRVGEPVTTGQLLGTAGQTGQATGPHLHFELLYNGIRYDPSAALGLTGAAV
jgi:murein DD-endopeptidase MepM/ murein hydrolase activator NlpD